MRNEYVSCRMWEPTYVAFLKQLEKINKKRPATKPMYMTEFLDEVAHGRIKIAGAPLKVRGTIS